MAHGDRAEARQPWVTALITLIGLDAPIVNEVRQRLKSIE